jgi:hypothetical protein
VASPDKTGTSTKGAAKMSSARRAAMGGGRFTPKGSVAKAKTEKDAKAKAAKEAAAKVPGYASSGRYTAPVHHEAEAVEETKPWVVPAIVAFLVLGLLLIVNYYVGVLPGGRSGYYLLGGLAAITGGFAVATQLK